MGSREGSLVLKDIPLRTAIFLDGGYLRSLTRQAGHRYDPNYIEAVALASLTKDETLIRVLYYDCPPFQGNPKLPISRQPANFHGSDEWLKTLSAKPQFAVRLGVLKFRGFVLRNQRRSVIPTALTDADFKPRFEQKGVDMRLGLDIANYAANRSLDRIILITGDTDCLPAMKLARTAGLQVVVVQFRNRKLAAELLWHSDYQRLIEWPDAPMK